MKDEIAKESESADCASNCTRHAYCRREREVERLTRERDDALSTFAALIGQMADVLSLCSEMLNGRDQFIHAADAPEAIPVKSPLTAMVDDAMEAWRAWEFGTVGTGAGDEFMPPARSEPDGA